MIPVPSQRLIAAISGLAAASLVLLVFPGAWPILLAANLALLVAAAIDLAMSPRPSALDAQRIAPGRMSVLNEQKIRIRVLNRCSFRLRLQVRDSVPAGLGGAEAEGRLMIPAAGEATWEYTLTPPARGCYRWGPIFLSFRTPLGLWDRRRQVLADGESRVYPDLTLLERYHLLARSDRLSALGIRRVRFKGAATEFESLREYTHGDDVRQIDWKATARRGRLTVRQRQEERNQTVLLLIDCGRLMNATEEGVAKLDHAVNAALLLSHVALARGDRVGICTFSGKVHSWLAPRGSLAQNRLVSETLYDLQGDFTESDHGRCLKFLAARHSKRSLLVVLTDFVDAFTASDMVAHLQLAARRHVVLFAALKDAFLERAARAPAETERGGFRKAAAVDLLHERQEVLERIRHAGGFVVDAEPAAITPPVINGYLEVVLGGLL